MTMTRFGSKKSLSVEEQKRTLYGVRMKACPSILYYVDKKEMEWLVSNGATLVSNPEVEKENGDQSGSTASSGR